MKDSSLSDGEAERRLKHYGLNQFVIPRKTSFLGIAKEEITEPLILLLLAVGVFYTIWGDLRDALTIFSIILILVFVEVWNEYRAKKAITSLSKMASPRSKVMREGKVTEVPTENVVPGDILVLASGNRVAADSKIIASFSILVDESSLTGESLPIEKGVGDEIYAGSLMVAGEGKAEVYATGKDTKFGKVSAAAQEIKEPKTPLQLSMKGLAKKLVAVALFFSIVIPLVGLVRGQDLRQMILTGLALAFATIPEEGPIIVTMILGIGAFKLSKEGFLVKKIKAAEVLGDSTVIVTDKTGTITESKMQVVYTFPKNHEANIVQTALATLSEMSILPIDRAISEKAAELKLDRHSGKILRERGFDGNRKTRAVIRETNDELEFLLIGAPEEVLSSIEKREFPIENEIRKETAKGRRVIAIAQKSVSPKEKDMSFTILEMDLNFVGLISLEDPPRQGVKETIELAKQAGIRTIMVTGDHPQTASFISESVGIPSENALIGSELDKLADEELQIIVKRVSVFARTTPEHKYRLVKALRANGEVVAVTGDGVNDALALKGADIGIAMGLRGTDAAREAADVVLTDDNFVTIGHGIFEGRKFFDNLKKGLTYYLAAKTALILTFILPLLLNIPFPFAPVQIIILELFMDLAASAGFVAEPAEKTIYKRPPKNPKKRLLDSAMIRNILVSGASLFAAVMLSYFYALWLNLSTTEAQTFAFAAWIIGHVVLAFVSRSESEPLWSLDVFSNRTMVVWALAAISFLLVAIEVPTISILLRLSALSPYHLGLVLVFSLLTIFGGKLLRQLFSSNKDTFPKNGHGR